MKRFVLIMYLWAALTTALMSAAVSELSSYKMAPYQHIMSGLAWPLTGTILVFIVLSGNRMSIP